MLGCETEGMRMSERLARGGSILATTFFVLLIVGLGFWFMIQANGLIVLKDPLRIVKTSSLSLEVSPRDDVTITVNGAIQPVDERVFQHLTPGQYSIKIEKAGFQTWERTIELMPGRVALFEKLRLFYKDPVVTDVVDLAEQTKYDRLLANQSRFQNHLQIIDTELWADDLLVTRYSQPIREAVWYIEDAYILVVVGDVVRVVDLTGTYDLELGRLPDTARDLVTLVPTNGGEDLVIKSDNLFQLWTITERDPFLKFPPFRTQSDSVESIEEN